MYIYHISEVGGVDQPGNRGFVFVFALRCVRCVPCVRAAAATTTARGYGTFRVSIRGPARLEGDVEHP